MDTNTEYDPGDKINPIGKDYVLVVPPELCKPLGITEHSHVFMDLSEDGTFIVMRKARVAPFSHRLNRPMNAELLDISGVHRDDNH